MTRNCRGGVTLAVIDTCRQSRLLRHKFNWPISLLLTGKYNVSQPFVSTTCLTLDVSHHKKLGSPR